MIALLCLFVLSVLSIVSISELARDKLTHIVIPYHYPQLPEVLENVASWSKYCPFSNSDLRNNDSLPVFIFYSSGGHLPSDKIAILEQSIDKAIQSLREIDCLNPNVLIQHLHATLGKNSLNSHKAGSRVMLSQLFFQYSYKMIGEAPEIFFYMEPDCLPIRKGWAEALETESDTRRGRFWMQGSPFLGTEAFLLEKKYFHPIFFLHINGNAMYNIGPYSLFREYYLLIVEKEHSRRQYMDLWALNSELTMTEIEERMKRLPFNNEASFAFKAYDMTIASSLFLFNNFLQSRFVLNKFLYTEVVLNYWRSKYCLEKVLKEYPDTFLIHGGEQTTCVYLSN